MSLPSFAAPAREEGRELVVALARTDQHEEVAARLHVAVERRDRGVGERLAHAGHDHHAGVVGDLLDRRQQERLDLVVLLLERELRGRVALGILLGARECLPKPSTK
jgi:hypothetical protein